MFALIYASAVYCLLSSRHNAVCLLAVSRVFCDLLIESPSLLVEPHVNSGVTILFWSRSHCPVYQAMAEQGFDFVRKLFESVCIDTRCS